MLGGGGKGAEFCKQILLRNIASSSEPHIKVYSLKTIGFICEDISREAIESKSDSILTAVMSGMQRFLLSFFLPLFLFSLSFLSLSFLSLPLSLSLFLPLSLSPPPLSLSLSLFLSFSFFFLFFFLSPPVFISRVFYRSTENVDIIIAACDSFLNCIKFVKKNFAVLEEVALY